MISTQLNIKSQMFNMAGLKDRRGITTQRLSVRAADFPIDKLEEAVTSPKWDKSAILSDFWFSKDPLTLGKLDANKFAIVVRAVSSSPPTSPTSTLLAIYRGCESAKRYGSINYFQRQRFGKGETPIAMTAVQLLKGDFNGAVRDYVMSMPAKDPRVSLARQLFSEGDLKGAAKAMPARMVSELALLRHVAKYPGDARGGFAGFAPLKKQLLFNALASMLWNEAASERLRRGGPQVVVGDLVLTERKGGEKVVFDGAEMTKTTQMVENVHVVSHADVETGKYTLADVVMPLPWVGLFLDAAQRLDGRTDVLSPFAERQKRVETFARTYKDAENGTANPVLRLEETLETFLSVSPVMQCMQSTMWSRLQSFGVSIEDIIATLNGGHPNNNPANSRLPGFAVSTSPDNEFNQPLNMSKSKGGIGFRWGGTLRPLVSVPAGLTWRVSPSTPLPPPQVVPGQNVKSRKDKRDDNRLQLAALSRKHMKVANPMRVVYACMHAHQILMQEKGIKCVEEDRKGGLSGVDEDELLAKAEELLRSPQAHTEWEVDLSAAASLLIPPRIWEVAEKVADEEAGWVVLKSEEEVSAYAGANPGVAAWDVELKFELDPGQYATGVVRELFKDGGVIMTEDGDE